MNGCRRGSLHDFSTCALITIELSHQRIGSLGQLQQGAAAAGDDPLFHGNPGRVQSIFNPQLAVLSSVSVGAPTLITATPPASLAILSLSFSRS